MFRRDLLWGLPVPSAGNRIVAQACLSAARLEGSAEAGLKCTSFIHVEAWIMTIEPRRPSLGATQALCD